MILKKSGVFLMAGFSFLFAFAALSCTTDRDAASGSGAALSTSPSGNAGIRGIIDKEWFLDEVSGGSKNIRINRTQDDSGFGGIYTLKFEEERISGTAAPNRYFGPYTAGEGNALSIGPVAGTLMASIMEPDDLKEHEYFAYLGRVKRWSLRGEKLELYTSGEDGIETMLVFVSG